jgi:hypothetical protein
MQLTDAGLARVEAVRDGVGVAFAAGKEQQAVARTTTRRTAGEKPLIDVFICPTTYLLPSPS